MERVLVKNAIIWATWWLIAYLLDLCRGKTVSFIQAITKTLAWGFVSHFMAPIISETFGIHDQGFVSAILGIVWFKVVELIVSGEFWKEVTDIVYSFLSLIKKR